LQERINYLTPFSPLSLASDKRSVILQQQELLSVHIMWTFVAPDGKERLKQQAAIVKWEKCGQTMKTGTFHVPVKRGRTRRHERRDEDADDGYQSMERKQLDT
jgi:hypothetical protein